MTNKMPDEIYAGDSFGYPMWRPSEEDPNNIVFIDDEQKYHHDDKYQEAVDDIKALRNILKLAKYDLEIMHHFDQKRAESISRPSGVELNPIKPPSIKYIEQALEQTKGYEDDK